MAFLYGKSDPKSGVKRWMGRIRIGDQDVAVSLRLVSSGTKRLAQQRVDTLQFEVKAGSLSVPTTEWLGPTTTARINKLMSLARTQTKAVGVEGWMTAMEGYIKSCEAKDSRAPIAGTARTVERTKYQRMDSVRAIARWLTAKGEPFLKRPFTQSLIDYINYRKSIPIAATTLWASDYSYGVLWGDWMNRRGLCERPDRESIREHMPPKGTPIVVLPTASEDAAAIRYFRDNRNNEFDFGAGGKRRTQPDSDYTRAKRNMAAWSLMLCVRGLGCRPSEATALTWSSVAKDLKTVHFLSTKMGIAREVPVLLEWTRIGLEELRSLHGGVGPVCRSTLNKAWGDDTGSELCWRATAKAAGFAAYQPKKSQKCHIAHLIKLGFPPHVVANWTGHTLSIQEKHYCEGKSYLPSREADEYGDVGELSEWGAQVRAHLASFANLLPQGR